MIFLFLLLLLQQPTESFTPVKHSFDLTDVCQPRSL
jgi:hypothetical protein